MNLKSSLCWNTLFVISFFFLTYLAIYLYMTDPNVDNRGLAQEKFKNVHFTAQKLPEDYNIWLIFTKVSNRSSLRFKFHNLLLNLLSVSSVQLKFHIIVDNSSRNICENEISNVVYKSNQSITYKLYDIVECASKMQDIVNVMTPHFSSKPGTYYSDALFYISIGLYRFAPMKQEKAVLLDCDLYFKKDVYLLFNEFKRFKTKALFGLAPELTPVYRHILHMYKAKHKTTFGDFYHNSTITSNSVHPRGFQGYNSGVVLINLKAQRNSKEFTKIISNKTVHAMTSKYKFRGHLGDQDFYTLIGFEYPDLIQTIHCGYNRQLCTWWRDHGYNDIFDNYAHCNHDTIVLHGNCNTKIPK